MMQACPQADKLGYGCLKCLLRTGEQGDCSKQTTCTDKVQHLWLPQMAVSTGQL